MSGFRRVIGVNKVQDTGKNKTQRLVIYYKFVGYLDIDPRSAIRTTPETSARVLPWGAFPASRRRI